jgi:hypothetical protein
MGDHWRNLVHQTQTPYHGYRKRLLLLGQHPVYLPGELHAQPRGKFSLSSLDPHANRSLTKIIHTGRKPRRQMRLCLGRHGILLLDPGLLLRPRDEGPLLPRDRHPVQPPRAGSQVEGYRHRRPGRRVRFWNELAAAAAEGVNIVAEESKECQTEYNCVARHALGFSHIP